ncbi:MAG: bifunctional phosphoribosylaminoimidazolecarboxamide formyltransferase/IMP cyclohydrolase PurH [Bacteroidetes bacterium]|nr:MAG: bifunctional phosphoribosylaminoimidazolecarboxamide formyltransferase/IMP cyclohydrolase PurH [Bacteroidota bacterium]TAE71465.1 MAG: bifunctional phosphoribosylaminoimidazolecarboxamide formyltransferase/IMP cyclohydrolase PurH [Bacteroidota bacterium]
MNKKISSALISVFYKDGLDTLVQTLAAQGVTIYSTGGTQQFIENLGIACVPVEALTSYPAILGGRVKTLHPVVFGGILGKRSDEVHVQEMQQYSIPEIDLVIVDLYPFEETVANTTDEKAIIEKIDIGGPSMIRAAAKNHTDVVVIASKNDYSVLVDILTAQNGATTLEQRKVFAAKAFNVVAKYDVAIAQYFAPQSDTLFTAAVEQKYPLRYGENPHQAAQFYGHLQANFTQLNGKELSYNNLVDVDAAIQLIQDVRKEESYHTQAVFGIIKHTNVCGVAVRATVEAAWEAALAGDPESAFGGVLVTNTTINAATAQAINEIFFEVLIAPAFDEDALALLQSKKNRILLQLASNIVLPAQQFKTVLNGVLVQNVDDTNFTDWKEVGGRETTATEKADLLLANIIGKHLKSNAIALVKNNQLIGKGCGQTSRIDALRQAIDKAKQFSFSLQSAVLSSDAFFPFSDCVQMAHAEGIEAFIQPGGSIRDKDSIAYAETHKLAMVLTGTRHFKH